MDLMNTMYVQDEHGNEVEMQILFTFDAKEKKYVVFQNPNDVDGEVYASCYDDNNSLLPIETEEEWALLEDLLEDYCNNMEEGCAGCQGNCDEECNCRSGVSELFCRRKCTFTVLLTEKLCHDNGTARNERAECDDEHRVKRVDERHTRHSRLAPSAHRLHAFASRYGRRPKRDQTERESV